MRLRTLLQFVTLAFVWGAGFTLIKVGLGGLTPPQLVLARLLLGAGALSLAARIQRVAFPRGRRVWLQLAGAGLLGNVVPFLLLAYGEQRAAAGVAGTLVGATPLLTWCIAAVALKSERVTRRQLLGMVGGFTGVVAVLAPWQGDPSSALAAVSCLGAAVSYAGGFVFVRRSLSNTGLPPISLAAGQLITAAVAQAALTPMLGWRTPHLDPGVLAATAVLGILGTGLAYLLYFALIDQLGATGAASVDYLVPVAAVITGIVALGEPVTWHLVAGGLLVLAGMAYSQSTRPRPYFPMPKSPSPPLSGIC